MSSGLLALALLLDGLLGDPNRSWHPVRLMGGLIQALERWARRGPGRLKWRGAVLAALAVGISYGAGWIVMRAADWADQRLALGGWLALGAGALLLWSALAVRSMVEHSVAVLAALEAGDLPLARLAVARMVGRDTADLDEAGVCRALLETVAEGFCDGVVGPLFFAVLGGAPAALAYRAANTLDSMLGYRDEHYARVGWASARLDDLLSWLPARQAALFTALAAVALRADALAAWRTAWRDGPRQPSPNSGWPEGAFAGALGAQLGGPVRYRGRWSDKALLGQARRALSPALCRRGLVLFITASLTAVLCYEVLFWRLSH